MKQITSAGKKKKKFSALLLTVMLVSSLAMPVLADEGAAVTGGNGVESGVRGGTGDTESASGSENKDIQVDSGQESQAGSGDTEGGSGSDNQDGQEDDGQEAQDGSGDTEGGSDSDNKDDSEGGGKETQDGTGDTEGGSGSDNKDDSGDDGQETRDGNGDTESGSGPEKQDGQDKGDSEEHNSGKKEDGTDGAKESETVTGPETDAKAEKPEKEKDPSGENKKETDSEKEAEKKKEDDTGKTERILAPAKKSSLKRIEKKGVSYLVYPDNTTYKGWFTSKSGCKYYCDPKANGAIVTGLKKIGANKYLFTVKGIMRKNAVITYKGHKYHADKNGVLKSGWLTVSKNYRMYFDPGTLRSVQGLVKIGRKHYIFDRYGKSRISEGIRIVDGKKYYCRYYGGLKYGWVDFGPYKMYFDKRTYEAKKGLKKIDGKIYFFKTTGRLLDTPGTPEYGGKKYWVNQDGTLNCGWLDAGSYKMCFRSDDYTAYVSTTLTIDGKRYSFDENGAVCSEYCPFWEHEFGVTRSALINYLNANKDALIGTPYGYADNETPIPGKISNCTGFVWYVLNAVATHNHYWLPCSDMRRGSQYYSPMWGETMSHFGFAAVFGGIDDELGRTGQKYVFPDKTSMLCSGVLEKGDIIWIAGTADTHVGFFWGDAPYEDKFWHSKDGGPQWTHIYEGYSSGNRISGIEACGDPLLGGYVVYKL